MDIVHFYRLGHDLFGAATFFNMSRRTVPSPTAAASNNENLPWCCGQCRASSRPVPSSSPSRVATARLRWGGWQPLLEGHSLAVEPCSLLSGNGVAEKVRFSMHCCTAVAHNIYIFQQVTRGPRCESRRRACRKRKIVQSYIPMIRR